MLVSNEAAYEMTESQCKDAIELSSKFPEFNQNALVQALAVNNLTDFLWEHVKDDEPRAEQNRILASIADTLHEIYMHGIG